MNLTPRRLILAFVVPAVVLLGLAACALPPDSGQEHGPGTPASPTPTVTQSEQPGYVDGARLKMAVLRADDGATSPHGWWDTDLGVPCTFQPASDGQTRCLPTTTHSLSRRLNGISFFADPTCLAPVGFQDENDCGGVPRYSHWRVQGGDCSQIRQRVFTVGSEIQPDETFYRQVSPNAECEAVTAGETHWAFFRMEELDPHSLVAAEIVAPQ